MLATKDPKLVQEIQKNGEEIAKAVTAIPDDQQLTTLVNKMDELFNKAQDNMTE